MPINDDIIHYIDTEWINIDERMDLPDYYEENGIKVPRVTKVIGSVNTSVNGLLSWANSLGFKRISYKNYMNKVSTMGTAIHTAVEGYIKDKKAPEISPLAIDEVKDGIMNAYIGFKSFWDTYNSLHKVDKVLLEHRIITPYFGGTADLIVREKDGTTTLYDFKSSNHLKYNHFVQIAAYKYGLECFTNPPMRIDKIGILLLNKYQPDCQEYILDLSVDINRQYIDDCIRCFISMLYAYYNTCQVENDFNNILFPRRQ